MGSILRGRGSHGKLLRRGTHVVSVLDAFGVVGGTLYWETLEARRKVGFWSTYVRDLGLQPSGHGQGGDS